jgi:hypothetical protein
MAAASFSVWLKLTGNRFAPRDSIFFPIAVQDHERLA